MAGLGEYAGLPITGTGVSVTRLSGGFAKAMMVEPVSVEAGDTVHLIVRAVKTGDRYEFEMDEDDVPVGVRLVQTFQATAARFSDEYSVRAALDEMSARIVRFEAERAGQLPFDLDGLDTDAVDLPPIAAARREEYGDLPGRVDEVLGGEGRDD